jgi:protein-tyrosine-phosphatase
LDDALHQEKGVGKLRDATKRLMRKIKDEDVEDPLHIAEDIGKSARRVKNALQEYMDELNGFMD